MMGRIYSQRRADVDYGIGYIRGGPITIPPSGVFYQNTPLARRVTLFQQRSHRVIDEMWSEPDGSFLFENLRNDVYYAIAWDNPEDATRKRAAIQDYIWPATD